MISYANGFKVANYTYKISTTIIISYFVQLGVLVIANTLYSYMSSASEYTRTAKLYTNMTGFAKRGLPHTSNLLTLASYNFNSMQAISLIFSHCIIMCCTLSMSSKYQINRPCHSKLWFIKFDK